MEVDAAWLDNGRMIGLVTEGSSTCIPVAGEASLNDDIIEIPLEDTPADTACTADMVARATPVQLPEDVDPTQSYQLHVTGDGVEGKGELDGVEGLDPTGETDYLPTAGWSDDDGQFVILSWGSSTCVPVIAEVAATSDTEVTVTFADPDADQVCTMDMVARAAVAQVDGIDDDGETFAILTGGEFDNIRIPIVAG
jgi:hypothetical protein